MGVLFERAQGFQQSLEEAANWYILAARQGRIDSMIALASAQMRLNYKESAISWYQLAARWNNEDARRTLSNLGETVPPSDLYQQQQYQQQQYQQQQENDYLMGLAITGIASALTGYYQASTPTPTKPTAQYTPPAQTFSDSSTNSNNSGCLSDY